MREQAGGRALDQTHAFLSSVGAAGVDKENIARMGAGLADAFVKIRSARLELTRFQQGMVERRADVQFNGRLRPASAYDRTSAAVER